MARKYRRKATRARRRHRSKKRSRWALYMDRKLRAKRPGRRRSRSGRVYYERRVNRSD